MVLGGTDKAWFTFKDCINYVKPQGMCILKLVNKYRIEGEGKDGFPYKKGKSSVWDDWKPAVTSYTLRNSFGFYFYLLTFSPPPRAVDIPLILYFLL